MGLWGILSTHGLCRGQSSHKMDPIWPTCSLGWSSRFREASKPCGLPAVAARARRARQVSRSSGLGRYESPKRKGKPPSLPQLERIPRAFF